MLRSDAKHAAERIFDIFINQRRRLEGLPRNRVVPDIADIILAKCGGKCEWRLKRGDPNRESSCIDKYITSCGGSIFKESYEEINMLNRNFNQCHICGKEIEIKEADDE